MELLFRPLDHPVRAICALYIIRTLILLLLAWGATYLFPTFSPLGYDTSSTHVTEYGNYNRRDESSKDTDLLTQLVERLVTALTRWDAIYFASIARRGHIWEQEWAFGVGQSYLLAGFEWVWSFLSNDQLGPSYQLLFFTLCSCVSHLASAILLFQLASLLSSDDSDKKGEAHPRLIAFLAALLHILSPAGVFLIAPYNESIFSMLSFSGYLLYSHGIINTGSDGQHGPSNEIALLASGILFGISSLFRANGIINGVLFVIEVYSALLRLISGNKFWPNARTLLASGFAGALVGIPSIWIQYKGWREFCVPEAMGRRDWCMKTPPWIYGFVQSHYWGVGFLRYWTPGNIPLFLLAAPTLYVLIKTSLDVIHVQTTEQGNIYALNLRKPNQTLLLYLTVPQLILSGLAITNYHVQIITRLSSALPVWYIVIAAALVSETSRTAESRGQSKVPDASGYWGKGLIRFFLGYQLVQAVLYGGFLPPA